MKVPGSAADLPVNKTESTGEVMIIIDGQKFIKSYKEALNIAGIIVATVCGSMDKNGQ